MFRRGYFSPGKKGSKRETRRRTRQVNYIHLVCLLIPGNSYTRGAGEDRKRPIPGENQNYRIRHIK